MADHKDPSALRTIGEVSETLGIKTHVLRYWEDQFAALTPLKRAGGRRLYRPEDVDLVREIDRLVNREGYTLKGAKAALKGAPAGRVTIEGEAPVGLIARLRSIRSELAAALGR